MPGTFTYNPTNGAVLPAGINQLSVTFTPADPVNYTLATTTVYLVVTPATPVIMWTNPVAVVYGTPLTTNQLNALASVPGTFVYNPTNGAVLPAGTNQLSVIFTPADSADYTLATATVYLVVNPATPLITWTNPAPLAYGAPLTTNQLNAQTSVAGTFVYNPTNGTVLPAGTNLLSVTFIPTDTQDYNTVLATVSLAVNPPLPSPGFYLLTAAPVFVPAPVNVQVPAGLIAANHAWMAFTIPVGDRAMLVLTNTAGQLVRWNSAAAGSSNVVCQTPVALAPNTTYGGTIQTLDPGANLSVAVSIPGFTTPALVPPAQCVTLIVDPSQDTNTVSYNIYEGYATNGMVAYNPAPLASISAAILAAATNTVRVPVTDPAGSLVHFTVRTVGSGGLESTNNPDILAYVSGSSVVSVNPPAMTQITSVVLSGGMIQVCLAASATDLLPTNITGYNGPCSYAITVGPAMNNEPVMVASLGGVAAGGTTLQGVFPEAAYTNASSIYIGAEVINAQGVPSRPPVDASQVFTFPDQDQWTLSGGLIQFASFLSQGFISDASVRNAAAFSLPGSLSRPARSARSTY